MKDRETNPRFYVEKGYEVTKLLRKPTSQPRVLKDTHEKKAKYAFTSAEQRKQLKSSVLLCLDVTTPCALVVSSNVHQVHRGAGVLRPNQRRFLFIRFVGLSHTYSTWPASLVSYSKETKPKIARNDVLATGTPQYHLLGSCRPLLGRRTFGRMCLHPPVPRCDM